MRPGNSTVSQGARSVLRHIGLRTFQTQKPFEDTAATRNQNAQKAFHDAEGLSQPHNGPVKALR
jgi:hypothetical protein